MKLTNTEKRFEHREYVVLMDYNEADEIVDISIMKKEGGIGRTMWNFADLNEAKAIAEIINLIK